ncbi:PQQ-binding-like beta-propeller repeat protein [Haloarcula nitratireducens]|uniref:PQQ-binding-like beta-propeller repeat protein n=1 Tax=Haloarcula nitratireducens TaxID=2487749 RepID=A0AAW4PJU3_9EURY|nr:PQQ-binding-like beta-propeller repeat protein [Halomicroarcula nitratireducens]
MSSIKYSNTGGRESPDCCFAASPERALHRFAVDTANGSQWEADTGETLDSPAVDADTVSIPSWGDERIYANTGTKRWHFDLESRPYQSPAVTDRTLFIGDASSNGRLYAVTGQ